MNLRCFSITYGSSFLEKLLLHNFVGLFFNINFKGSSLSISHTDTSLENFTFPKKLILLECQPRILDLIGQDSRCIFNRLHISSHEVWTKITSKPSRFKLPRSSAIFLGVETPQLKLLMLKDAMRKLCQNNNRILLLKNSTRIQLNHPAKT